MSARPILRESAGLVALTRGQRVALVDPGAEGMPVRAVEEIERVGVNELRTVPLGALARAHDRGVGTRRWSRKTGASVLGGVEVIRPATAREVAVWQAKSALEKAKTAENRARGWWTAAVDLLAQKRAQLADADAACERRAAEHVEAQRKLTEAEAALRAAEAGPP